MLTELAISLGCKILDFILYIAGVMPDVPTQFTDVMNFFFDNATNIGHAINFILDVDFVKVCLPVSFAIYHFEYIYRVVIWILKKIPFLNIK